jgi:O-antigen/teichoic acid export membrane protein
MSVAKRGGILRFFSASILIQGVLSAANLCVGLLLIRRTSDLDYSYYVLVSNAILLLTVLQYAYSYPSMIYAITSESGTAATRGDFVGGMYREQRTLLLVAIVALATAATLGRLLGAIGSELYFVVLAGIAASAIGLYREFFRMVLLAHRGQGTLLRGDLVYASLLVAGAAAATWFAHPAIWAITAVALAALVASWWLKRAVYKYEAWNIHGRRGLLREIFAVGAWATVGAGSHWAFTQGYNYLVAGVLSVASVAAIAATRTLIMPVNLISLGIGNVMLPTATRWLQRIPTRKVMFRHVGVAAAMVLVAAVYMLLLWVFRDWIFAVLLRKQFANRDHLLLAWFAIGIAMVLRDQLGYLLMARARFRATSFLTMFCAALSLLASFFLMRSIGAVGSLLGLLLGETCNVMGIIALCVVEIRRYPAPGSVGAG